MADIPKRYLERFLFWGSFVAIFMVLKFVLWIHNTNKLATAEHRIAPYFKTFNIYEKDVYLPSVKVAGPDGKAVDLTKNNGRYTVLNIWATWCTPCIKELPALKKLNDALRADGKWRVVAVSIDTNNNLEKLSVFTKRYGVAKIANYHDYNLELQKNINIKNLPMTLIIGKSGRILYEIYGDAPWDTPEIAGFLDLVRKVY